MATHNYSTEIILRNIPNWVDGDRVDLSGTGKLIIDESVNNLGQVDFNGVFQALELVWASTTSPMIINVTGNLVGNGGTLLFNGGKVSLPNADGSANQTFQVPSDSLGRYPQKINHMWIGGNTRWTQVSSLADLYGDGMTRGCHFTYNNSTGIISCGDGTNGARPNGTVQIENIYLEHNNNTLFSSGTNIRGSGGVVIFQSAISSGANIDLDENASWGIADYNGNFTPATLFSHKYRNFSFINSDSSINTRTLLGESHTNDHIIIQTESTATTEAFSNARVAMNGLIEIRCINQKLNSAWPRLRMYNDGGNVTFHIMQGEGTIFTPYGGTNGTWRFYYTEGYKRTDNKPYRIIHGRYDGRFLVPHFGILEGDASPYINEEEYILDLDDGYWEIGEYSDDPSDDYWLTIPNNSRVDEVLNFSGYSRGILNRLRFLGEASSGSRDGNTWTPRGWTISNVKMPNDSSHGFQPEDNQELHFVSHIGIDPSFGRNMSHSTLIKNSAGTQGQVWFMPHPDGENAGMLAGVESDLTFTASQVYYQPNTQTYTQSGVLQGWQTINGLHRVGSSLDNFTFAYKLWSITEDEPASYTTVSWSGNQADSSSLATLQSFTNGHTTQTKKLFKYTILKNSQPVNIGEIRGFYLDVTLDPNFIWIPANPDLDLTINAIDGSRVVAINYTKSTKITDQYGQEIVTVPVVIDNTIVSGGAGYSGKILDVGPGQQHEIGDIVLLKINWHSGTQAKMPLRIFAPITSAGIDLFIEQEDDEIHNNMVFNGVTGLDGSTVDSANGGELTANFTNVDIEIDDSDDTFDCRRGIAWWRWINTTEQGALFYDALGLAYLPDEYNIEIRGSLKVKNAKIGSRLNVINGIWKHYQGESIIADDSEIIVWVPNDRVYPVNIDQVNDIKTVVDQNLDVAISTRATQTSVNAIPTSPLLANDSRLNNLDSPISEAGASEAEIHSALDSYANKSDWKESADITTLTATVNNINTIITLLNQYHDGKTRYLAQDGQTVVSQEQAYFVDTYNLAGTEVIKRIRFIDSNNNPINLGAFPAGYDKVDL